MKFVSQIILSFVIVLSLFVSDVFACTTFCLKRNGEVLFGKNYDWSIGDGIIFINKRGVSKKATVDDNPASWVSEYGSLTFNQYGRENPSGGMNEAGLVVELMWLDDTKYPGKDGRFGLGTLEWIQYQLDTSATVEEVIRSSDKVRISAQTPLHYLVNDKNGNSTTIEFLDGKLVAHTGQALPVATLTNDTYQKSLNYAKPFENASSQPGGIGSLQRFARASNAVKNFAKTEKAAVDYAFEILASVAQGPYTQWSIVYDQQNGRVFYRTRANPTIKSIDFKSFDYSCTTPVKMFGIDSDKKGEVNAFFTDYTYRENRDLIERSFNGTEFLRNVPGPARDEMARFPETFGCADQTAKAEEQKSIDESLALDQLYLLARFGLI